MDFEHKSRARWENFRPDELCAYLEASARTFASVGGSMLHVPRQVEVKEVNQKDRSRVRGKLLERTWPSWVGFMPDGRALAMETISTSHPEHFRVSMITSPVFDWLEHAAQAGGVACVFVRSSTPRDYLLRVSEQGLIEGRTREELFWWEELDQRRVRPGERWWEVLE